MVFDAHAPRAEHRARRLLERPRHGELHEARREVARVRHDHDARELDLGVDVARQRRSSPRGRPPRAGRCRAGSRGCCGRRSARRSSGVARGGPARRVRGSREVRIFCPSVTPARISTASGVSRPSVTFVRVAIVAGDDVDGGALLALATADGGTVERRPCVLLRPTRACANMPTLSRRSGFGQADARERRVRGRVDRRRDGDDLAVEAAVRVGVRRDRRASGRPSRGPGARPGRRPRPRRDRGSPPRRSAAPPCRPPARRRPTSRLTTCPEMGDVHVPARAGARPCRAPPGACSRPASAAARWSRASSTSLPAAMPRWNRRSVRSRLSRAFSSAALACASAAPRLPLLVVERPRIDLGYHLAGRDPVALGHGQRCRRGPATSAAILTSWFGSATTAPRTTSGSTRSRRATVPVSAAIVGTSAEAISSSLAVPAARRGRERRDEHRQRALRASTVLLDRSTKDVLQVRDGRLKRRAATQVLALHVAEGRAARRGRRGSSCGRGGSSPRPAPASRGRRHQRVPGRPRPARGAP